MSKNKENAEIGNDIERTFISLLLKNKPIIDKIKKIYNIPNNFVEAHPTGTNQKKSDVLLLFNNFTLGVNIKAGKTNFNQVTRMWLEKFSQDININNECVIALQNGIDNHRLKRKKIFIESEFQELIKREFSKNKKAILELIFRGINNDIVKILALHDRNKKIYHIYDMENVINLLLKNEISFSNKGILKIGNYITLQRKGGNGIAFKMPKSDPKHPGNQIQFKMKILSFMNENKPMLILK